MRPSQLPLRPSAGFAALLLTAAGIHGALAGIALTERWPVSENACADTPLRLTFDQPPVLGEGGTIEVRKAADGKVVETVTLGTGLQQDAFGNTAGPVLRYRAVEIEGNTASVRLRSRSLGYGEAYVVKIGPGVFKDFDGTTDEWKFTTKPALPKYPDKLAVASDGSGDFCTVQGAIDQVDPHRTRPTVITIRKGNYRELVRVSRDKPFVHLVGEDRKGTVISFTNNDRLNPGWINRSVLGVEGDDFSMENLTLRNTTPKGGSQAEAICLNAERCVLKNVDFFSTQDTLHLTGSARVSDCYIEGDVDYVWGYGSAFFERCELRSTSDGYVLQARNRPGKPGYVFLKCKFTAGPDTKKSWLARIETGRFPASQIAFIDCEMGPHIPAAGWVVTGGDSPALRFEEFRSKDLSGKPLDVSQRHPQSRQITEVEAAALSDPAKFLSPSSK